jgi:hypothetical protein
MHVLHDVMLPAMAVYTVAQLARENIRVIA